MGIFNNREIAVGIWGVIFFLLCLIKPTIRSSLTPVVVAFFDIKILVPLGLMAMYIGLVVYGLYELELWTISQLKNTILWGVSVAMLSLFRIADVKNFQSYFKVAVKDNFKLIIVLEFIVALYTFPLWVELIIIPTLTLLACVLAYSGTDKKYSQVERLLDGLFAWFGLGLVFYAVFQMITSFGVFAQQKTLADFSLPPILFIFYLPFLFMMNLYVNYENAFVRLQFIIPELSLRGYARRCAIIAFHFRTELLKRWVRNLNLADRESKQNIKDAIREVKVTWEREKNPEEIPFDLGWSPFVAREFLITEGLTPRDYHRSVGGSDDWCSNSDYLGVGDGLTLNNIAYYIEGEESVATKLKLVMDINTPDVLPETSHKFCEIAGKLFAKALENEIPGDIKTSLLNEIPMTTQIRGKEVIILKEIWPGHRMQGYSIKFIIQNSVKR
jgi:hypothetical protein